MSKIPTILPFKAVRYNPDKIAQLADVIAPPYDVISPEQQKELYAKSAHNIAWLDVTQEDGREPSEARYAKAAGDFQNWQDDGILQCDSQPGVYVYEQVFTAPDGQTFTRRGFYALRRLERFGEGSVFPHEQTLAGPKKDRLTLMKATDAQLSPIFGLFHEASGTIATLLEEAVAREPLFEMTDDSGQIHRLWQATDPRWIEQVQTAITDAPFLIADGHHRYETALAYRDWREQTRPDPSPEASYKYVLMFCESVEDPGLLVLPTHRLVQNRPQFSAEDFLAKVRDYFQVEELADAELAVWRREVATQGQSTHSFGIAFHGDARRFVVTLAKDKVAQLPSLAEVAEPLRSLDAKILHSCFLEDFLGYAPEDQENPEYIQYLKSDDKLIKELASPGAQLGILMNPAPLSQIRTIAEAGQFMPPKTTYFYPKLPTGLVISKMD